MKMITSTQCLLATRACLLHREDNEEIRKGGDALYSLYKEAMLNTKRISDGVYSIDDKYGPVIEYLAAIQLVSDANKVSKAAVARTYTEEVELTL